MSEPNPGRQFEDIVRGIVRYVDISVKVIEAKQRAGISSTAELEDLRLAQSALREALTGEKR